MKKVFALVLALVMALSCVAVLSACGKDPAEPADGGTAADVSEEPEGTDDGADSGAKFESTAAISVPDTVEIVQETSYYSELNEFIAYAVAVKNNGGENVKLTLKAEAKDASGAVISNAENSIKAIGAGQTSYFIVNLRDVPDADAQVTYTIEQVESNLNDALANLTHTENVEQKTDEDGRDVTVWTVNVTNNGDVNAEDVQALLICKRGDTVVSITTVHVEGAEAFKIAPGETGTKEQTVYGEENQFDTLEVFLNAYAA